MVDILLTAVLILLNASFSLSELAVISSRRGRLKALAERGSKGARAALALFDDPGRFLSTVQIGITLVGILAGAFSGATIGAALADVLVSYGLSERVADPLGFGLVVGIVTFLSVVVGELVPKQIALRAPEAIAVVVARPLAAMAYAATPLVALLDWSSSVLLRLFGIRGDEKEGVTEDEVKGMIADAESSGVLLPAERRMISGIMRLADRSVRAIMTPRPDVEWIDIGETDKEIVDAIRKSDRTWLLACDDHPDNVVGVLRARRLLQDRLDGRMTPIRELLHHPVVFPDTLNALQALDRLHESRSGIGLVVDEYGHTVGLVTRADALRAIRSDHSDDDEEDPMIVRREDGSYLIAGALPVDTLMETIPLQLPPDPDYHTVAGLVLHQLRRMPKVGDGVTVSGWRIEVVDLDRRRIDQVLMTKVE
ncbi:MAG: HlyC/CorC family transporter [Enhydrobacter sp.]|nr:HlyC/CorC family transporter [Enhydrobacter sp.]